MEEMNKKILTKEEAEEIFQKYIDSFSYPTKTPLDFIDLNDKNKDVVKKGL